MRYFILIFVFSFSAFSADRNVTFDFQSISIRDSLQLLAEYKNQNIVIAPDVSGDITMKLNNVSWDDAFDYVMTIGRLDAYFEDDIIFVSGIGSDYLSNQNNESSSYPLTLFKLNNVFPDVISNMFHLYDGEFIIPSTDTSSIAAYLPLNRVDELRYLIDTLDVSSSQMLIEARIVEVNRDFVQSLGVNWGFESLGDGFNYSAFYAGDVGGIAGVGLGFVGSRFLLDAKLSAMESQGKGAIVSSPKVFVFDRKTAKISKGFEVPYQELQGDGVVTTSFKSASLSLEVTPVVNGHNIMLDINLTKDEPDFSRAVAGQPPINTSSFTSSVSLKSGDTIALGGVFTDSVSNVSDGVPVLSSVPLLGRLFRSDTDKNMKSELLLFLTATMFNKDSLGSSFDYKHFFSPVDFDGIELDRHFNFSMYPG